MYRCKGRTRTDARCKRRVRELDGYCSVHCDLPGMPIEVEHIEIPELPECFKDGDPNERVCGHTCGMTLDRCCECTDARAADAVPAAERARYYCKECKPRFNKRLPQPPPRLVWHNFVVHEADRNAIIEQILVNILRR